MHQNLSTNDPVSYTHLSKVSVEVENPQMGELTSDTTYIGTVEPQQQVYVMPKLSGTVTQVNYKVGDTVKEGDVLFKIDEDVYKRQGIQRSCIWLL